jgi:hypothetical protein
MRASARFEARPIVDRFNNSAGQHISTHSWANARFTCTQSSPLRPQPMSRSGPLLPDNDGTSSPASRQQSTNIFIAASSLRLLHFGVAAAEDSKMPARALKFWGVPIALVLIGIALDSLPGSAKLLPDYPLLVRLTSQQWLIELLNKLGDAARHSGSRGRRLHQTETSHRHRQGGC